MDQGGLLKSVLASLLLLLAASTVISHARVFSQRTAGDDVPAFLEQLGGQTAYRAPVRINGESAQLRVIGFDDPGDTLMAQIRLSLKLPSPAPPMIITYSGGSSQLLYAFWI